MRLLEVICKRIPSPSRLRRDTKVLHKPKQKPNRFVIYIIYPRFTGACLQNILLFFRGMWYNKLDMPTNTKFRSEFFG